MNKSGLYEIGKNKNSPFRICPVCGHAEWCIVTDGERGSKFVTCMRMKFEQTIPGLRFIKFSSKGNPVYLVEDSSNFSNSYNHNYVPSNKSKDEAKRKSDKELHKLNSILLNHLKLEDYNYKTLVSGGITKEMIECFKIRSCPPSDYTRKKNNIKSINPMCWELAKVLQDSCSNLTGFPGAHFVERDDKSYWSFAGIQGTVFPVPNVYGEIVALQVRLDNTPTHGGKYRSISSASNAYKEYINGCSPSARIGLYKPPILGDTYVCYITEGAKKGISIAFKGGALAISVPGVGSWRELFETNERGERPIDVLRNMGVGCFILAYDGDKYTNNNVLHHDRQLGIELFKEGFSVGEAHWDSYMGKGIDDVYNNGFKPSFWLYRDSDIVLFQQQLKDIEKKMVEEQSRKRVLSQQPTSN